MSAARKVEPVVKPYDYFDLGCYAEQLAAIIYGIDQALKDMDPKREDVAASRILCLTVLAEGLILKMSPLAREAMQHSRLVSK